MTVATTIVEQLGGRQFCVMNGVKAMTTRPDGVAIKIGRGAKNGINIVDITLNTNDYYDIKFKKGTKVVVEHTDVCVDVLRNTYTNATGFYCTMRG